MIRHLIVSIVFALSALVPAAGATDYFVTLPDDAAIPDAAPNSGSLRWCIEKANLHPGTDSIHYQLTAFMIVPASPYEITDSVRIYGSTAVLIAPDGGFTGDNVFEIGDGSTPIDVYVQSVSLLGFADPLAPRAIEVRNAARLDFYFGRVEQFSASRTGTVFGRAGSFIRLKSSTFADNAMVHGGAVYTFGGLEVTYGRYEHNSATQQGGAVYATTGSRAIVTAADFVGNSAGARGGALHLRGDVQEVWSSTFDGNSAGIGGGGVYFSVASGRSALVSGSNFTTNDATAGGALGRDGDGEVAVLDCVFYANRAVLGGGLYLDGGGNLLERGDVQANVADEDGGGLWYRGGSSGALEVYESLFAFNAMANGGSGVGGGAFLSEGPAVVENTTLSTNGQVTSTLTNGGNLAAGQNASVELRHVTIALGKAYLGGGVWSHVSGSVSFVNTLVGDSVGGGDCVLWGTSSDVSSLASDKTCSFSGPGSANKVPLLLLPLANYGGPTDSHDLDPASPAIDAANPSWCPAIDQRGEKRPRGRGCDVGAIEAF